ncbi:MAG TPA: phenylalanine--tRNA ligase subunit beta [Candidatus Paceibacterota bacterium]|nr:phenylalanine--tRNA ligase subunit beta [Candidatus Paceibacterota bacterium]
MKVSYQWLQTYFASPLPAPADIAQALISHSFEVEEVVDSGSDQVLDIKVLPDRAHDCLSHFGIAKEIAAVMKLPAPSEPVITVSLATTQRPLEIAIADPKLCRRYISRVIEGVAIQESPAWIRERLSALGQRSINSLVDATNFVLFDIGQPLHVFDADKVKGKITVRSASEGERIVTLDDRDIALDPSILVIADEEGPIAIAGVKGGKRAEVDADTKNVIVESANFDPASVRKTATKLGLRTDAVKRFENELSQTVADFAMDKVTALIAEWNPEAIVGHKVDVYPAKREAVRIEFGALDVENILGIAIPDREIVSILERLQIVATGDSGKFTAYPPVERLDLVIKENIVEEIGRVYGYDRIPSQPPLRERAKETNQTFLAANKLREILVGAGFTEHYGYTFSTKGDVELENPLVSGEQFLRTDLTERLKEKIDFNIRHLVFDQEAVRLFDIGSVFPAAGERIHCAIGIGYKTKKLNKSQGEIEEVLKSIREAFKGKPAAVESFYDDTKSVVEFAVAPLAEKVGNETAIDLSRFLTESRYQKFSLYPRIIRDVALFVPPEVDPSEVGEIIREQAGGLVAYGPALFDVFEKKNADGVIEKKSLAYRLVFQSFDRTLSDEEVNPHMDKVAAALRGRGWEVR